MAKQTPQLQTLQPFQNNNTRQCAAPAKKCCVSTPRGSLDGGQIGSAARGPPRPGKAGASWHLRPRTRAKQRRFICG
ncbi:hypothetical protein EVAR_81303_1 [Eumeta japonica]|uniref:Uncharacterized protein n=1 Tax=Eumeta variegata TaxID=151549 RepID=A0A4C1W1M2_EUMVA|nr:hypothetical protein EVAR_81303_1 [Eumeta japonica]